MAKIIRHLALLRHARVVSSRRGHAVMSRFLLRIVLPNCTSADSPLDSHAISELLHEPTSSPDRDTVSTNFDVAMFEAREEVNLPFYTVGRDTDDLRFSSPFQFPAGGEISRPKGDHRVTGYGGQILLASNVGTSKSGSSRWRRPQAERIGWSAPLRAVLSGPPGLSTMEPASQQIWGA